MSEQKIYNCDCCEADLPVSYDPDKDRIHVPVGLISDPAGGASTTDNYSMDLCQRCLAKAVGNFLNNRTSFVYNDRIKYYLNEYKKFILDIKNMTLDGLMGSPDGSSKII